LALPSSATARIRNLERASAIGKRLKAIDFVPAAARGYPKRDPDPLAGITPRIQWSASNFRIPFQQAPLRKFESKTTTDSIF